MVNKKQKIDVVDFPYLKGNKEVCFVDCFIDTFDLIGAFELNTRLSLEGCIINNLKIHSCWFVNGLVLKYCVINNFVDYQMGGHNIEPIVLEGNVFKGFFNFFDCHFENIVSVKYNVFMKGTNLLGNKGEGFANEFDKGWLAEANVGSIDLDDVDA